MEMKEMLKGIWRTHKVFCYSGKIEQHHESLYLELSIDEEGTLTLFHSGSRREISTLRNNEWNIEERKGRRFLCFGKRQAFEFITIEPEELVLADIMKGEKLFFTKMPAWYSRIQPNLNSIRHITAPWQNKTNL
jgi:hypothetical protein